VVRVSDYQETGALRLLLEKVAAEQAVPLKDLTVLSPQVDPFRLDTPANHRAGAWLANAAVTLGFGERTIHLRGFHYAITQAAEPLIRPDGLRYVNDDDSWEWLEGTAAKAARWLGYIPFDQIVDKRNAEPVVRTFERAEPWPYLTVDVDVDIPSAEDLMPSVGAEDFDGVQPYRIVLIGEKASLDEVLAPIADRYKADLFLPTGNISDTLVHQIAKNGAEDGRPMVVLYFSDSDPSGWNMPIEVGRKLQAFQVNLYPGLRFRQYRAALTPAQVREHDLPSAPLKGTEKRADRWRAAMGIEQTEIDALATLRPELLDRIARDALDPFYDWTLDRRVMEAYSAWLEEAKAAVTRQLGTDRLNRLWAEANAQLATIREQVDALRDAMRIDVGDFDLPAVPPVPEPIPNVDEPMPLLDSAWPFDEQCRRLIASKAYRNGDAGVVA
jgi:hypothetical protein